MASLPKTKSENVHLTYVLLVVLLRVITSSIELHKFETAGYFPQLSQGVLRCHRNYESPLIAVYVVSRFDSIPTETRIFLGSPED